MFLPLFKPNKAGLFEGSFSERCQSDPPPSYLIPSYFIEEG